MIYIKSILIGVAMFVITFVVAYVTIIGQQAYQAGPNAAIGVGILVYFLAPITAVSAVIGVGAFIWKLRSLRRQVRT